MTTLTQNPVWKKLNEHFKEIVNLDMRDCFSNEPNRFDAFSLQAPYVFLDYSKNRITQETINLLIQLAESVTLKEKIEDLFAGQPINITEHRAVLHTALRSQSDKPVYVNDVNVIPEIHKTLQTMRTFTDQVRNGSWLGFSGKCITDIVNIGIGGSDLGPKMACEALKFYSHPSLRTHFISNVDATQIVETLKPLNPETTLFIVASKTFSTTETLTNAQTAKQWLLDQCEDQSAVAKHFAAVTTNIEGAKRFGIDPNNTFAFWDWVGGRYSMWSAIGLPIALSIGMDHFIDLLTGAYEMDQHFYQAPFYENMPILLALLGIWYRNFFNVNSLAIIPYSVYLQYLPAYLQQLVMESNGKSVTLDGSHVDYATGEIIWGGIGTDVQHSFHQLLHQGTELVPIDFIIPLQSLNPVGNHHELLFANCLAQSQALLLGKTLEQVYQALVEQGLSEQEARQLAPHKVMVGNRPSNTILLQELTPHSLGALIALYEHKVFVEGVIWNIDSFDQWGVELGKKLAKNILGQINQTERSNSLDSSTQGLLSRFIQYNEG